MNSANDYHPALAHLHHWLTRPEQGVASLLADTLVDRITAFHSHASKVFHTNATIGIAAKRRARGACDVRLYLLWPESVAGTVERRRYEDELRPAFANEVAIPPVLNLSSHLDFVDEIPEEEEKNVHFMGLHGLTPEEELAAREVMGALQDEAPELREALRRPRRADA
jgi:hypothetical protein